MQSIRKENLCDVSNEGSKCHVYWPEPEKGESLPEKGWVRLVNSVASIKFCSHYGLNRGKRKANRDIGKKALVTLVTSSEASKLKDS